MWSCRGSGDQDLPEAGGGRPSPQRPPSAQGQSQGPCCCTPAPGLAPSSIPALTQATILPPNTLQPRLAPAPALAIAASVCLQGGLPQAGGKLLQSQAPGAGRGLLWMLFFFSISFSSHQGGPSWPPQSRGLSRPQWGQPLPREAILAPGARPVLGLEAGTDGSEVPGTPRASGEAERPPPTPVPE